jgi:hypothetical protein
LGVAAIPLVGLPQGKLVRVLPPLVKSTDNDGWHHVVCSWDGVHKSVWVDETPINETQEVPGFRPEQMRQVFEGTTDFANMADLNYRGDEKVGTFSVWVKP